MSRQFVNRLFLGRDGIVEESIPSDSGFVVDWQLADGTDVVIDLSMAEAQGLQSELVTLPAPPSNTVSAAR